MTELSQYREAVAEAEAEAKNMAQELRSADRLDDSLRAKADAAIAQLTVARGDLQRAEALEAEVQAAREASPIPPIGPQQNHAQNHADEEAYRAVGEALSAKLRNRPIADSAAAVFAQYGAEEVFDQDGSLILPDALLLAAERVFAAQRAATGSTNIATHSPLAGGRVFGFVRPQSVMESMGIMLESVDPGTPKYGWVNSSPDATSRSEDTSLSALSIDAATMLEKELTPKAITAARGWTIEAGASVDDLVSIVTDDAQRAVAAAVESQVFNGGGTAPALDGINRRAGTGRTAAATVDTFATAIAAFTEQIDGTYATGLDDLRVLVSPKANAFLDTLRAADSSMESVASYLMRNCASYRVSAYAPDDTENEGSSMTGVLHDVLVRRGMVPGALALPSWGLRVGRDEQTALGVGVKLVAWRLLDLFVPQSAGSEGNRADWVKVGIRSAT